MTRNILRKYGPRIALVGVSTLPLLSHAAGAAVDVSAATDGIAAAGVAILAVLAALMALSVSVFGLAKAYSFVKRRAGA